MKSFLALALEAAQEFRAGDLRQPLVILATADEESSMDGARALAAAGQPLGRHALIGEPTGLKPVRMHKGILMEAIRLEGRSGHSSNPALGVNALEGMHRVMGELLQWRAELQARYRNPLFEVEVPTLNLGHIHGGDNPNRICADCELHIDLRPLPGMGLADLREELHGRLERLLADNRELKLRCAPLFAGIEAMETPATAAIVQATEQLTGVPAGAVSFGTEGPYLNALGMETVILGPGSVECAHQPDEFLPLATISADAGLLRRLIGDFAYSLMTDIPLILGALGPVFGLILIGFGLRRSGFPGDGFWPAAERLTYFILFPALLIQRLALSRIGDYAVLPVAAVIIAMLLTMTALVYLLRSWLHVDGPAFTSVYQGAIRFNTYVGLAVALAVFNAKAASRGAGHGDHDSVDQRVVCAGAEPARRRQSSRSAGLYAV